LAGALTRKLGAIAHHERKAKSKAYCLNYDDEALRRAFAPAAPGAATFPYSLSRDGPSHLSLRLCRPWRTL